MDRPPANPRTALVAGATGLVGRKVALLSDMGGAYPQGREFNFYSYAPATARVVGDWPTPVSFRRRIKF